MADLPKKVKDQIDSRDENIIWSGQPVVKEPDKKKVTPVITLTTVLGVALALYALLILILNITEQAAPLDRTDIIRGFKQSIRDAGFSFIGALAFLFARWWLPRKYLPEVENHRYYVITDQRAMIIDDNHDPNPKKKAKIIKQWGSGDILAPLKMKGAVLFTTQKVVKGKTVSGKVQEITDWDGFHKLRDEDIGEVVKAIKSLRQPKDNIPIENSKLRFKITRPQGWTVRSYKVNEGERDNVLLNVLTGDMVTQGGGILKEAKIDEDWNTLVMTRRVGNDPKNYLTIILESAAKPERPAKEVEKFKGRDSVNLSSAIHQNFFAQGLRNMQLICEFREAYLLTGKDFETLKRDIPEKLLKQLGAIKDREYNEEAIFRYVVQEKLAHPRLRAKKLLKYVELAVETARRYHPCVPAGKAFKVRVNEKAKKAELNDFTSYEMDLTTNLMDTQYRLKQVYSFQFIDSLRECLHLRYTFFCTHKEKSKTFDSNVKTLTELANSTKLLPS